jgi:hypothetical protein
MPCSINFHGVWVSLSRVGGMEVERIEDFDVLMVVVSQSQHLSS